MLCKRLTSFISTFSLLLAPSTALCWGGRHWSAPSAGYGGWNYGYWYHGAYLNNEGWWWVVGPTWYYYSTPMYPYPSGPAAYYVLTAPPPPVSGPPPGVSVPSVPGSSRAFSYKCESSQSYYPLVTTCNSQWVVTGVKPPPGEEKTP
jgi:hypothetical protein